MKSNAMFICISIMILLLIGISGCTNTVILKPNGTDIGLPVFDEGQKIMVFVAHQDDEAIGAATIMSRGIRNGGEVELVVTTDGAPKEFGHGDFEAEVRKQETIKAMSILGVPEDNIRFMGYDDRGFIWEIDVDEEIASVASIIAEEQPTQVYVHAYEGGHIDHDATHYIVSQAISQSGVKPKVYEFPEYNGYRWGEPIPSENDLVDNEKYPTVTLNLTEEEKELKKEVLKQYVSQHPFKKNLITKEQSDPLGFAMMEIVADGIVLEPEDLKDETKDHYIKIASVSYRPIYDIPNDKSIFPEKSEMTYLTEYGKLLFGEQNPSFRQKTDFLMDNYDFFVMAGSNDVPSCRDTSTYNRSECGEMLIPEKIPSCKKYIYHCERYHAEGYRSADSLCNSMMNLYDLCIEEFNNITQFITNSYGGTIPNRIMNNYRLGSYYKRVDINDPIYGGIIETSPWTKMDIVMGVGNYDEEITLYNVTLEIRQNQKMKNYLYATHELGDLGPRSIVFDTFNYFIYSHYWKDEKEPLDLVLILRGKSGDGIEHKNYLFFTIDPVRPENDIEIVSIGGGEIFEYDQERRESIYKPAIKISVSNPGLSSADFLVKVRIPELTYLEETDIGSTGDIYSKVIYLEFNASDFDQGTYDSAFDLYATENGEETLIETIQLPIIIIENGFKFRYPDGRHMGLRNYREIDYMLSQIPEKYKVDMENCDEDDYLICLFYWPDMIRELPPYDYSHPPHERPPALGYENRDAILNETMTFESFRDAFK
jgi:LmbE family N-acetylglucosaminyl deacetylase